MKKAILFMMMVICTLITVAQDDTLTLNGKANPTATINGTYPICLGDTATIPVYLANGPTWDVTFSDSYTQWTVTGITTSPYLLKVSPPNTRSYVVSLVDNGTCSAPGPPTFAMVTIEPAPSIYTISCATTTFCQGSASAAFVTTGSESGNSYEVWYLGAPVVGTAQMSSGGILTFTGQSAAGVYTVVATNPTGCTSTMNGSITLTMDPLPGIASAIFGSSTTVCEGTSASFSTNVITDALNYVWSVPIGSVITSNTGTSITVEFGNQSGSISVFGQNNCGGGTPSILNVTVNPAPTLVVTASPTSICFGENSDLTANTNGTSFEWSGGILTQVNTVTPTITTTYAVTVTGSNGCTATDDIMVTVNQLPIVTLVLAEDAYCTSTNSAILDGGLPAGGAYSGSCVFGGNTVYPPVSGAGTYTVTYTYTDGYGCSASATDLLTINPIPAVSFTNITGPIYIDTPPFDLMGYTSPTGGTFSGTGILSGSSMFEPKTAGAGTHMLTYTYVHPTTGCSASQIQYVTVGTVGVEEVSAAVNAVNIFPNPANNRLNLTGINTKQIKSLKIMNVFGEVVYATNINADHMIIDVSNYSSGTYFISFNDANGLSKCRKIVK